MANEHSWEGAIMTTNQYKEDSVDSIEQWLEVVEPMFVGGPCNADDIAQAVARLHLQPGQAIPTDWATCPICCGEGCGDCDGCGKVHPKRQEWLEEDILQDHDAVATIERWLKNDSLPHQAWRTHAWWSAQAEVAIELIKTWKEEDRHDRDLLDASGPGNSAGLDLGEPN